MMKHEILLLDHCAIVMPQYQVSFNVPPALLQSKDASLQQQQPRVNEEGLAQTHFCQQAK